MIIIATETTDKKIVSEIVTVDPLDNIPEPGKKYSVWLEEIKEQEVREFNE